MQRYLPLLGRVLLGLIFVMSGVNKVMQFGGTQQYMESFGMPATAILLVGAIVFEIGGGLMVIAGFKARLGALALVLFLIPATLIFHTDFADQNQMIHFMKNLSIMGGLLFVIANGAGAYAVDKDDSVQDAIPA
jgi:putative oxidoreductase